MEAIKIVITFATYMKFKLFQMNMKRDFLNGHLKKEVYVRQPLGFIDVNDLDHGMRPDKVLSRLK